MGNYGKIAWPLTQELKKDPFQWDEEALAAFEKLKHDMTIIPVLAVSDSNDLFVVVTDSFGLFHNLREDFRLIVLGRGEKTIQSYVRDCEVCQKNKYQALCPAGLLQLLTIPAQTWSNNSIVFYWRAAQRLWF